jgi:branched-chain amino acid transport system permease protein
MTLVWSSVSLGAVYAIVAIGYNIVFIASRVFNFAQAQFVMLGAFVALQGGNVLHLPLWLTLILCAVIGGVVGALEEILAVRRLYGRDSHAELVTTLGVSTILSGLALINFGPQAQTVPYFANDPTYTFLGGRLGLSDILIVLVAVLLAGIVALVARKTMIGLSSLAASEDRDAAMLRGINVKLIALGSFVAAGAAIAVTGPFVSAKTFVSYDLGDNLAVKAFVALAIGGFGSQLGAVVGGLAVGFFETYAARFLGSDWRNIAVFVILLIVMSIRPNGIFGRRAGRTV